MWSAEEVEQIHSLARSIVPDIKLHAIPTGLQVETGPDAIIEHLVEKVPPLLDSYISQDRKFRQISSNILDTR
jgi:hypothetical protein